jgi:hypothetical protein
VYKVFTCDFAIKALENHIPHKMNMSMSVIDGGIPVGPVSPGLSSAVLDGFGAGGDESADAVITSNTEQWNPFGFYYDNVLGIGVTHVHDVASAHDMEPQDEELGTMVEVERAEWADENTRVEVAMAEGGPQDEELGTMVEVVRAEVAEDGDGDDFVEAVGLDRLLEETPPVFAAVVVDGRFEETPAVLGAPRVDNRGKHWRIKVEQGTPPVPSKGNTAWAHQRKLKEAEFERFAQSKQLPANLPWRTRGGRPCGNIQKVMFMDLLMHAARGVVLLECGAASEGFFGIVRFVVPEEGRPAFDAGLVPSAAWKREQVGGRRANAQVRRWETAGFRERPLPRFGAALAYEYDPSVYAKHKTHRGAA